MTTFQIDQATLLAALNDTAVGAVPRRVDHGAGHAGPGRLMMHDRRCCETLDCSTCRNMRRAHLAFITNPRARLTGPTRQQSDPVFWADAQTSYHDLRAALCLAGGVPVSEIDPCTGHYRPPGATR